MDYPPPSIPLSPVLSRRGLQLWCDNSSSAGNDSILHNPHLLHVTSGRSAIALALEQSAITKGNEVLIPAYHCESMVSPVKWRGASPVFYRINHDTSIDIEDIKLKITTNTRAIIVTHYFGFIQHMPPIAQLCKQRGLLLIEDCAHAFFGSRDGKCAGAWGDYAIASSMKFFPVYDGGILASHNRPVEHSKLTSPSLLFQIKSTLNVVQSAIGYGRLGLLGIALKHLTTFMEHSWRLLKKALGREQRGIGGPSSSGGGYGLDEEWIHSRSSVFSRWIIKHQVKDRIADKRRRNYLKLASSLSSLPHSYPLFSELPKGIVPLVFPLYVESPQQYFDPLKRAGVPIWRFGEFLDDDITQGICQNSVELSAHLFQFPCHQDLTDNEISWMVERITDSFNESSERV
jgi:perosamine synthetase